MQLQRHQAYYVPEQEISSRIDVFQSALRDLNVPVALLNHVTDLYYYAGSIQDAVLVIPDEGQPTYFVRKSQARAKNESPLAVLPHPGFRGLVDYLKKALPENRSVVGLAFDVATAGLYHGLQKGIATCPMVDVSLPIRRQKAVKSAWEIQQVTRAAHQAQILFSEVDELFRLGLTELELSGAVEGRLRALGHGGPLRIRRPTMELAMLCAVSGSGALFPTNFDGPVGGEGPYPSAAAGAGQKTIERGETFMLDMVTSYNGYHADNARTFFAGSDIPDEVLENHRFCLDCLDQLEGALRPGKTCAEVFSKVQAWVHDRGEPEGFMGFGENRVKFFGHGVGLELDELPVLAAGQDFVFQPGTILAVEPKAFLSNFGPVGVENTYRITETGCVSLCNSEKEVLALI